MDLLGHYHRFFRDEREESDANVLEEVRAISGWMDQPYHEKFLKWLDEQSSKPLDTGVDHATLIKAVTRVETFKEVEKHLSKLDEWAKNALQQFREGA